MIILKGLLLEQVEENIKQVTSC